MSRKILNQMSAEQAEKLRIARMSVLRGKVPVSQSQVARETGMHKTTFSALEYGRAATIPLSLLYWFSQNGVNLNDLLNPAITPEQFGESPRLGDQPVIKEQAEPKECPACKEKDEKILLYKRMLNTQEQLIISQRARIRTTPYSGDLEKNG